MNALLITTDLLASLPVADTALWHMAPPPKSIPGVDDALNTFFGWALWIVSVLSLLGLLFVMSVGFESYRRDQAEDFMEKAKSWVIAAIIGAYAKDIVTMFFPGFRVSAVATAIPGLEGAVTDIIGNIMWLLGWAAFGCIIFLAVKGFLAYRSNGLEEFLGKFFWFIVASLGISFVSNIAGAFFPAALTFG